MTEVYHAVQQLLFNPSIEHVTPDCTCQGKKCTRCEQVRCIGNFHHYKGGYRPLCKICRKVESGTEEFRTNRRARRGENADHINELKRASHARNPEKHRGQSKTYRENNPEKTREGYRRANHTEAAKRRNRTYREAYPEKVIKWTQEWKASHPLEVQESAKVRAANHKAKKLGIPGKLTVQQWRKLKAHYDYTCLRCGKREPEITLTPDHIIPFALRGINDISNVQPLCEFCNTSKGVKVIDYRQDVSA